MALQQIGFVDLIAAIQERIEADTDYKCYDAVPLNQAGPFYYAEAVQKRADNTKTMFRDVFTVWVHCISSPQENGSNVEIYGLIQDLDEAMTIDIDLDDYWLQNQTNVGVQSIYDEETKEKHAVCAFEFTVSYGFRTKN